MKYIGPFFRMNSISTKEIESQLLFLCRESLKHIVLESRCGISITPKNLRSSMSNDDIGQFKNNNPLLCIYRKAKPNIYSSKHSKSWDNSTFKKEIPIESNAFMTLSMLQSTTYYDNFRGIDEEIYNISKLYKSLSKLQLEFYYTYLRNNEGFFISKKNGETQNDSEFNLYEKDSKYSFSEQAYMMLAYYTYAEKCPNDEDSINYKSFSLDILEMFLHFKDNIYDLPFYECCKIAFCFNIMYEYCKDERCKELLIDISEFILSKYHELNPTLSNLETTALLALDLIMCYNNTKISLFKDAYIDILTLFNDLYNVDKNTLQKPSDKKEIKYYSEEIMLYLINMLVYYNMDENKDKDINNLICQVYKQYCVNSGLITSFPEAPNLDSSERYLNLSLRSKDLLDESMFRMATSATPELTGLASTFIKSVNYSTKKETFSNAKVSFDSNRNMFLFFVTFYFLLPKYNSLLMRSNTNDDENSYIDNFTETSDNHLTSDISESFPSKTETTEIHSLSLDRTINPTVEVDIYEVTLPEDISSNSLNEENIVETGYSNILNTDNI